MKQLKYILASTFVIMLLHTAEEYVTKLYAVDPFIAFVSRHFNTSPFAIYTIIQSLALVFILFFLIRVSLQKFDTTLAVLLGVGFLIELTHPYNAIVVNGYYPGLYTGLLLILIGGFYYWHFLRIIKP